MSRACVNSFLASSEEVVTGIFPPPGEAEGAGAELLATSPAGAQPLNAAAQSARTAADRKSLKP
jgi:hypothetical protein